MPRAIGGVLGLLCALHCLAVPLFLALAPGMQLALHQFGSTRHALAQALLWSLAAEPWLVGLALLSTALTLLRSGHRRGWLAWILAALLMLTAVCWSSTLAVHVTLLLAGSALLWLAPRWPRSDDSNLPSQPG